MPFFDRAWQRERSAARQGVHAPGTQQKAKSQRAENGGEGIFASIFSHSAMPWRRGLRRTLGRRGESALPCVIETGNGASGPDQAFHDLQRQHLAIP
jgi:hypothetical protein